MSIDWGIYSFFAGSIFMVTIILFGIMTSITINFLPNDHQFRVWEKKIRIAEGSVVVGTTGFAVLALWYILIPFVLFCFLIVGICKLIAMCIIASTR